MKIDQEGPLPLLLTILTVCRITCNSLLPTPALLALLLVEATLTFLKPPPSSSAPDDEEAAAAAAGVLAAAAAAVSELKMAGAESP